MNNVKLLYEFREAVIKLPNDYSSVVSEARYKSIHVEGIKILVAKQMLQRFLIAVAYVKAGNTSENLLKQIRQVTYSLYKNACNNIMNSIEL